MKACLTLAAFPVPCRTSYTKNGSEIEYLSHNHKIIVQYICCGRYILLEWINNSNQRVHGPQLLYGAEHTAANLELFALDRWRILVCVCVPQLRGNKIWAEINWKRMTTLWLVRIFWKSYKLTTWKYVRGHRCAHARRIHLLFASHRTHSPRELYRPLVFFPLLVLRRQLGTTKSTSCDTAVNWLHTPACATNSEVLARCTPTLILDRTRRRCFVGILQCSAVDAVKRTRRTLNLRQI